MTVQLPHFIHNTSLNKPNTSSKKDHPTFSGNLLREAIEEPMAILATNYRMREAEAKPREIEFEEWIKPGEEEMGQLEKFKSEMATMSRTRAMWLKGALEQQLETELMPMFCDAMPDDCEIGVEPIEYRLNFRFAEQAVQGGC